MEICLEMKLRARNGLIWLATLEEDRSVPRVQAVAERLNYAVFEWDCVSSFRQLSPGTLRQPGDGNCGNIDQALKAVAEYKHQPTVFLFRDLQLLARRLESTPDYVVIVRRLRDMDRHVRRNGNGVVFLASSAAVPAELEECMTLVEASLPDREERTAIIAGWLRANASDVRCHIDEDILHRVVAAAAGMSSRQIQSALALSVVKRKALVAAVVDDVLAEKVQAVKTSELLEYVQVAETIDEVGGMEGIKDYVRKRALSFGAAAARYGLPTPKGILLLGPPGTGKSLLAKVTAGVFQMPLLRLDLAKVYGSLVGQSEERMRRALAIAESQAPCVLWIDELEKAFAGASGPSGDSGVAKRVFGTFLTWTSERTTPVFTVATANDIRELPPEFLRKGRFDELFFVDLPTPKERRDILEVLLRKYRLDPKGLVTERLVERLDRYAGAEVEFVVREALYEGFYDSQRPVNAGDLELAVTKVLPLADQRKEDIEALRRWGRANARSAS